jgi:hypothetical protein
MLFSIRLTKIHPLSPHNSFHHKLIWLDTACIRVIPENRAIRPCRHEIQDVPAEMANAFERDQIPSTLRRTARPCHPQRPCRPW